jgi:hypothetical protein
LILPNYFDDECIKKYQSLMIGSLQWVIIFTGRFDIITVLVMALSAFQAAPQEGHVE